MHLPLSPGSADPEQTVATSRLPLPVRRLVAMVVGAPVLLVALAGSGGGFAGASPGWIALVALTSLLGAVTVASFVPLRGQRLVEARGCAPCAAVALLTVLGAAILLGFAPGEVSMAVTALALVAAGLLRRLGDLRSSTACPTG